MTKNSKLKHPFSGIVAKFANKKTGKVQYVYVDSPS